MVVGDPRFCSCMKFFSKISPCYLMWRLCALFKSCWKQDKISSAYCPNSTNRCASSSFSPHMLQASSIIMFLISFMLSYCPYCSVLYFMRKALIGSLRSEYIFVKYVKNMFHYFYFYFLLVKFVAVSYPSPD